MKRLLVATMLGVGSVVYGGSCIVSGSIERSADSTADSVEDPGNVIVTANKGAKSQDVDLSMDVFDARPFSAGLLESEVDVDFTPRGALIIVR